MKGAPANVRAVNDAKQLAAAVQALHRLLHGETLLKGEIDGGKDQQQKRRAATWEALAPLVEASPELKKVPRAGGATALVTGFRLKSAANQQASELVENEEKLSRLLFAASIADINDPPAAFPADERDAKPIEEEPTEEPALRRIVEGALKASMATYELLSRVSERVETLHEKIAKMEALWK